MRGAQDLLTCVSPVESADHTLLGPHLCKHAVRGDAADFVLLVLLENLSVGRVHELAPHGLAFLRAFLVVRQRVLDVAVGLERLVGRLKLRVVAREDGKQVGQVLHVALDNDVLQQQLLLLFVAERADDLGQPQQAVDDRFVVCLVL